MPTEEELFDAVDALLEDAGPHLPEPVERARLREAAGVTQARLAQVLRSTTQTVKNWEAGRSEPRPPRLQAYARLLEGWAARYTTPEPEDMAAPVPAAPPSPAAPPAPVPAAAPQAPAAPARTAVRPASRKSAAAKAASVADARFGHGP